MATANDPIEFPELPDEDIFPELEGIEYRLKIQQAIGLINIQVKHIGSYDHFNNVLLEYCNLVLLLWGMPPVRRIEEAVLKKTIQIGDKCVYLGNRVNQEHGCKTLDPQYDRKKQEVIYFLKDILLYIIKKTPISILKDTSSYIKDLDLSIGIYCSFIGALHLGNIYIPFTKLLFDELNTIFEGIIGRPLIIVRCLKVNRAPGCSSASNEEECLPIPDTTGTGYGCSRMHMRLTRDDNSDFILFFSNNEELGGNTPIMPNTSNIRKTSRGGKRKTRKRKSRKQK